jgi:hypothetical protein
VSAFSLSSACSWLCDFQQVGQPLCAPVIAAVGGHENCNLLVSGQHRPPCPPPQPVLSASPCLAQLHLGGPCSDVCWVTSDQASHAGALDPPTPSFQSAAHLTLPKGLLSSPLRHNLTEPSCSAVLPLQGHCLPPHRHSINHCGPNE